MDRPLPTVPQPNRSLGRAAASLAARGAKGAIKGTLNLGSAAFNKMFPTLGRFMNKLGASKPGQDKTDTETRRLSANVQAELQLSNEKLGMMFDNQEEQNRLLEQLLVLYKAKPAGGGAGGDDDDFPDIDLPNLDRRSRRDARRQARREARRQAAQQRRQQAQTRPQPQTRPPAAQAPAGRPPGVNSSKWSKFLKFLRRRANRLYTRIGAKLATSAAGLGAPGIGWLVTAVSIGLIFADAVALYQMWQEFSSLSEEEQEAAGEGEPLPESDTADDVATRERQQEAARETLGDVSQMGETQNLTPEEQSVQADQARESERRRAQAGLSENLEDPVRQMIMQRLAQAEQRLQRANTPPNRNAVQTIHAELEHHNVRNPISEADAARVRAPETAAPPPTPPAPATAVPPVPAPPLPPTAPVEPSPSPVTPPVTPAPTATPPSPVTPPPAQAAAVPSAVPVVTAPILAPATPAPSMPPAAAAIPVTAPTPVQAPAMVPAVPATTAAAAAPVAAPATPTAPLLPVPAAALPTPPDKPITGAPIGTSISASPITALTAPPAPLSDQESSTTEEFELTVTAPAPTAAEKLYVGPEVVNEYIPPQDAAMESKPIRVEGSSIVYDFDKIIYEAEVIKFDGPIAAPVSQPSISIGQPPPSETAAMSRVRVAGAGAGVMPGGAGTTPMRIGRGSSLSAGAAGSGAGVMPGGAGTTPMRIGGGASLGAGTAGAGATPMGGSTGATPMGGGAGAATGGTTSRGSAASAMQFFQSKGWTPVQAAGLAANLQVESSFDPNAVGDNGRAYGIAQWHPDRQAAFQRWAGREIRGSTFEQQLEFINFELTQGNERRAGTMIRQATTAEQAAALVDQYYERSNGHARPRRMALAASYAAGMPGASTAQTQTAAPAAGPNLVQASTARVSTDREQTAVTQRMAAGFNQQRAQSQQPGTPQAQQQQPAAAAKMGGEVSLKTRILSTFDQLARA